MSTVVSKDGTTLAFDRIGDGPAVILVDGALCHRSSGPNGPLAALLAERFTVYTYDRRGRGDSGDTAPYAVEREVEDIEALIAEAGGSAFVYGISSGAALALEAAERGLAISKLALYEAPFIVDDSRPPVPQDYRAQISDLLAAGRRGDTVKYFMRRGVGLPAVVVAMMRFMPAWAGLTAVAHTLAYDAAVMAGTQSGRSLPAGRWASVTPPTLVAVGGKSPGWMHNAMAAVADALPNARRHTLKGQTHIVKPQALAPVLIDFFAGSDRIPAAGLSGAGGQQVSGGQPR
ncbi:alpha/beta fold hydrolase [Streptosporangium roseum]|uniref:alpha/beta fold hydrolase n=1 Tax=Streptosporangium roseum TaxID=2001 RepID=UPI003331C876